MPAKTAAVQLRKPAEILMAAMSTAAIAGWSASAPKTGGGTLTASGAWHRSLARSGAWASAMTVRTCW